MSLSSDFTNIPEFQEIVLYYCSSSSQRRRIAPLCTNPCLRYCSEVRILFEMRFLPQFGGRCLLGRHAHQIAHIGRT